MKKNKATCTGFTQSIVNKHFLFTFLATLATVTLFGATITSTSAGGAWSSTSTWVGGVVPGANDDVVIASGATVTVPSAVSCRTLALNGNLNLTGTGMTFTITNNSTTSAGLVLNSGGKLLIGSTNTLNFSTTQGTGITNNGGSIVSTGTNGADGGSIVVNTCCGGQFTVSGSASTTVNNLKFASNANFNLSSGGLLVNGKLSVFDNNFSSSGSSLSPVYGSASTLYISWNGQGISSSSPSPLNGNLSKLWSQSSGTIGVTQGYPNNVTILNVGTSNGGVNVPPTINVGWRPNVAVGLNGTLQIGDATASGTNTGFVSLDQVTSFSSGGIVVDNGSALVSPPSGTTFIDKGDFILQGSTTGAFYNYGATIDFAGSGTHASPNVISTTGSSGIAFGGVKVSSGYVQLQDPVTVSSSLNLAGGYIGSTSTNTLTVTNTASTAVTGGSSTSYVDGPLSWSFPASPSGSYVFPVGDYANGPAYLPLTLTSANSSSGTTITVQGINQNPGGTRGDLDITSMSTTEYWSVSSTSSLTSGATVDAQRPSAVTPNNTLASSSSANGVYDIIGGSPSSSTKISGGGMTSTNPSYIRMVAAGLTVVRTGGTPAGVDGSCNPTSTGSLIVGGIGGTSPYTYSVAGFNGGAFQSSNTFGPLAKGAYTVTIKDNTGATATAILHVLGAVQINGNDQDIDICSGQSTTLTATNSYNNSPTYSWSPGGQTTASITVSPTTSTTYTVTSTVYANNLITNGGFESGTPSGFNAGYTLYTGAQYGTTPGSGGLYSISNSGVNQCSNFFGTAAEEGSKYFIADGSTSSSTVFSLNFTGLTVNTVYQFSYYYIEGNTDATSALLQTSVTGGSITSGSGNVQANSSSAWKQATYNIKATSTSMTITLTNLTSTGSTNGNDFYIDNLQMLSPCTVTASITVTTDCTLPVELVGFNVVRQGEGAHLTWQTSSEHNNSYFVIEKSTDGKSFTPIGKVDGAGNSSIINGYSFTDPFIEAGIAYYRLAQYDMDGSVHYSEIKVVSKNDIKDILVVPNPNNGIFDVIFNGKGDVKYTVNILNAIGQIVYESIDQAPVKNIDISNLSSAVYYLQISTEDEAVIKKIVKE